jgi:uncharacterized protein YjiS (DUF1127 family)
LKSGKFIMTMTPIASQAPSETAALARVPEVIGQKLTVVLRLAKARALGRGIRLLDAHAGGQAGASVRSSSPTAWIADLAARPLLALAKERRIRRGTRELMAMSDPMLKDIGLTRADIDHAARYGRD